MLLVLLGWLTLAGQSPEDDVPSNNPWGILDTPDNRRWYGYGGGAKDTGNQRILVFPSLAAGLAVAMRILRSYGTVHHDLTLLQACYFWTKGLLPTRPTDPTDPLIVRYCVGRKDSKGRPLTSEAVVKAVTAYASRLGKLLGVDPGSAFVPLRNTRLRELAIAIGRVESPYYDAALRELGRETPVA